MHRDYGCVGMSEYRDYVMRGVHPTSWSGDVGGGSVVILSESEMVDLIQGRYVTEEGKSYYTKCYFAPEMYKESSSFYDEVIPVLKSLVPNGGIDEDVRIVFDFDS